MIHPRGWRSFTEYGNGIMGDMGIHMLDMVRWMLNLGWPSRISSSGGIHIYRNNRRTSRYSECHVRFGTSRSTGSSAIGTPAGSKYWWAATFYGDRGISKQASSATTTHRSATGHHNAGTSSTTREVP